MGSVVFISTDGSSLPGEVENKLACTVAKFLGRQMRVNIVLNEAG
jgi:hypothetical protein